MTLQRHRFAVLLDYERKRITDEQAVEELGVSRRTLQQLHTLWAGRLSKVVPIVDRLMRQTNTKGKQVVIKNKLADVLGVTYRQVNRLLKASKIEVPMPVSSEIRVEKRETAVERRKKRRKYALDVIAGLNDIENAAEWAEVSTRHIYRLAEKMLGKVDVNFKDMKTLTHEQRLRIVKQLEGSL